MTHFEKRNLFYLILLFLFFPLILQARQVNDIDKGIQLFEVKKFAEAKIFFESFLSNNQNHATAASYLGRIFLQEGNYEKAIPWFQKAVELDDKNSDYHLWLGRAYGIKAQRASILKKASAAKNVKKEFEKAVELNPDNLDARLGLLQFYAMAPGIMGGNHDKALVQAEEIKKRDAQQGHVAFGLIYMVNEQYDLAEKEYLTAIEENPQNYQSYYQLVYIYARQKKFDKAFEVLENLIQKHPEEVVAYFQLGWIAVMSGQKLDRGEECLKKYLQTEPSEERPSFAFAHYLLGNIQKQKSNKELAKAQYEEALKLNPKFEPAKKAIKELNN